MDYCNNCRNQHTDFCDSCVSSPSAAPSHFVLKGRTIPIQNINFEDKPDQSGKYKKIGESIGRLVDEKNRAYGDSFNKAGDFLKLLYPNGVQPEQYGDMLGLVRVFDKQMRIATAKDALGENPWRDIGGYAILKSDDK